MAIPLPKALKAVSLPVLLANLAMPPPDKVDKVTGKSSPSMLIGASKPAYNMLTTPSGVAWKIRAARHQAAAKMASDAAAKSITIHVALV